MIVMIVMSMKRPGASKSKFLPELVPQANLEAEPEKERQIGPIANWVLRNLRVAVWILRGMPRGF